jgi:Uma2 family endonuclease
LRACCTAVRFGLFTKCASASATASAAIPQTQRTLTDAVAVFEVLSDDTAATDRVEKLRDYAAIPSVQYYVMLEQASRGAVVCQRAAGSTWTTRPVTEGGITLPDLGLTLPLDDIYQDLSFPPAVAD